MSRARRYHPRVPTRRAYAKINLALSVGPPLPGRGPGAGMHPIASWMHSIDLWDEVEVSPAGHPSLDIGWAANAPRPTPIDWPPEKDLAWRAVYALGSAAGRRLDARITIQKRIPTGGGLGGGSSDAAAALLAANDAFGLGFGLDRLAELSLSLGSDVAYFLDRDLPPRPAVVAGLGDRIARLEPVRAWAVLILPPFGCPTGAVYKAYDTLGPRPLREGDVAHMAAAGRIDGGLLFNDLWEAAVRVQPALGDLRERVRRAGPGPVCMSGSGSTLFIPCRDGHDAERARRLIAGSTSDAAILSVRLV